MTKTIGLILVLAALGNPTHAETVTVALKNKEFDRDYLKIKLGDAVEFKNEDPWFHNPYSLSELQSFDLGPLAEGKAKTVVFEQEGKVEVECAIHSRMYMMIEVTK
ncbi:MAG: methylamine utilization protein [Pseudomonadota bacterium]